MSDIAFGFQSNVLTLVISVGIVATAILLGWVAWWRSGRRRVVFVLESLRVALVLVAVMLLNQPEVVQQFRPEERPQLVVLADATKSMRTPDVIDPTSKVTTTRAEAVAPLLEPAVWREMNPGMEVVVSTFGAESPEETNLYEALERVRTSSHNLRAVVLLSDGDWNTGLPPVEAAQRMRTEQIPIYPVAVGSPDRLPDLEIAGFDVPAFGIAGKNVRLPLVIESSLPRDHTTVVRLRASDGTEIEHQVQIAAMGRTRDTIVWRPEKTGNFTVSVELPAHPDEVVTDNNRLEAPIAIRRENLRVLVIESLPRWEYRYLRNALIRDPGVDVRCLLFHPGLDKVGGGGSDYLPAFPEQREELAQFDVVFLGDVGMVDGQLTKYQCELLKGMVEEQASGLVFLPGLKGYQHSLLDSPLEPLMPVVLDVNQPMGWGSPSPSHFALTLSGRGSLLTRLVDSEDENLRVWEHLPGFQWYAPVLRAKAGTTVLAVHQEASNQFGRIPLLVTRTFGAGKVLFMGTDGAWRWRRGVEDRYHYRFWGQVVRWMAYQRNMARGERMRFYYSPEQPKAGYEMALNANVMADSGEPVRDGTVTARIRAPSGRVEVVHLEHSGDQWGLFVGQFKPDEAGVHRVELVCAETRDELETEIYVHGTVPERIGKPIRADVLSELARVSGGQVVSLDELDALQAMLADMPEPPMKIRRLQLWCHPLMALIFIGLLGAFWSARKMAGLV